MMQVLEGKILELQASLTDHSSQAFKLQVGPTPTTPSTPTPSTPTPSTPTHPLNPHPPPPLHPLHPPMTTLYNTPLMTHTHLMTPPPLFHHCFSLF